MSPTVLRIRSLAPAVLAAATLLAPIGSPRLVAQQQLPSTPVGSSFEPIGLYNLEIDGKAAPDAVFFHSQATKSILIRTSALPWLVELQPRGRVVATHAADSFHTNRDGTLDRMPRAAPLSTSTFELVDSLPRFVIEGRRLVVREKPPLLGPQTAEGLVAHDPSYGVRADQYQPQALYIDELRQLEQPIRVRVFLGTWCPVCSELMPHVLRVEQELRGSQIEFEYYGLPRDFDDPEAKRLEIKHLPTGIVYAGDQELGRISGYSWRFPDMSLRNLLLRSSSEPGS